MCKMTRKVDKGISSGSSRNAPGISASVSTVVTEAWSVENYQQPGTVLVLARRMNSGSDAIKNNCIPYAGRVY